MADARYTTLAYTLTPPVALVTLDRPQARNRVSSTMAAELRRVCQRLREDRVRVAVITGRGRAFCVGREAYPPAPAEAPSTWLQRHRAATALAGVDIPLIAAINGNAVDQGLELALACDLRLAVLGATLGFTDVTKGVLPWDGGTQRLPRLVGRAAALEMLLTSRLVDAEEACRMGLVNEVVESAMLLDRAMELAETVASGAPIAARYTKETVLKGMDLTLEQGLRLEADLSILLQSTEDRSEGLRSFSEKHEPRFRGE